MRYDNPLNINFFDMYVILVCFYYALGTCERYTLESYYACFNLNFAVILNNVNKTKN